MTVEIGHSVDLDVLRPFYLVFNRRECYSLPTPPFYAHLLLHGKTRNFPCPHNSPSLLDCVSSRGAHPHIQREQSPCVRQHCSHQALLRRVHRRCLHECCGGRLGHGMRAGGRSHTALPSHCFLATVAAAAACRVRCANVVLRLQATHGCCCKGERGY